MGNTCCSQNKTKTKEWNTDILPSHKNKANFSQGQNQEPACCRADNQPVHLPSEEDDQEIETVPVSKEQMRDKIVLTQYQESLYEMLSKNVEQFKEANNYFDDEFKPELSSISKDIRTFEKAKNFVWRRAQQFSNDGQLDVFQGQIEPNDIKQGSLGDCYFLSALSALAEFPNLISRLFITKEHQKSGCYAVWLCYDGEWQPIIIDDFFPCYSKTQGPAFSKGHGPELWVLIMEKAYAKLFGAYDKIEAGLTGQAIRDLTGAPYEFMAAEDPDLTWKFLLENDKLKHILTAGSNSSEEGVEIDNGGGIVSGHAYAVIQCREVTSHKGVERLVKLRNPWGSKEWEGDWSDKSDRWTPQLKQELNWTDKDDGVFWMNVEDFCQQFSDISCNYVKEDYYYSFQRVNMKGGQQYALLNLKVQKNNTNAYISLVQRDQRNYAKDPSIEYQYSYARIFIARGNNETVKCFVTGNHQFFGRQMFIQTELQKGDYLIFVEMEWAQNFYNEVVVSTYSSSQCAFQGEPILPNDNSILDAFFFQRKSENEKDIQKYPEDDKLFRVSGTVGGYMYFNYINNSQDGTLYEKVNMTTIENLTICPPYTDSNTFEITVAPGQHQTVQYKIFAASQGKYSYKFSRIQKISFSDGALIAKIQANPQQKDQRKYSDELIEVYMYSFFYSGGLALYYENFTDQTYVQELHLKLKNLKALNFELKDPVEIQLAPNGGAQLLKLQEIDSNVGVSYGMSYSFYLE